MGKEAGKEIFQSASVDAVLLTNAANMRFVSGFIGEGYVYLSKKSALIVTDSRYTIAAAAECPDFQIIEWNRKGYYAPFMEAARRDGIQALGIEDEEMTVSAYEKLASQMKEAGADRIEIRNLGQTVTKLRAVKTEVEIENIRRAEAIGDVAFSSILGKLCAGMTEKEVAAWLEFYMKKEGADGLSFDTIAASGVHSAMPHAVPTDKALQEGDFLTMDFGCLYRGYCSDMTRTVVIGRASEKQKLVYNTVLRAQEEALRNIRPGMSGKEIDAMARNVIKKAGYGKNFGHSLGHSVGLEIHEKPCFSPNEEEIIRPGMVITVEPGIYIENFGGVRIEDVVVITEDGCENITHSEKRLIEVM